MPGETKEDRKLEEHVRKIEGSKAPQILRQYEKNAKEKTGGECHLCVRTEDRLFPDIIEVCGKCLLRTAKRYETKKEKIYVISRKHYIQLPKICMWCSKGAITYHTISVKLCEKCLKKIGKKNQHQFEAYKEAYGKSPQQMAKVMKEKLNPGYAG